MTVKGITMIQTQRSQNFEYQIALKSAKRSAQYFIDRGTDARGQSIKYSNAYMQAAIRRVNIDFNKI
jgi:hypothetical protein